MRRTIAPISPGNLGVRRLPGVSGHSYLIQRRAWKPFGRFGLVSTHEPVEETLPLTELLLLTAARTQHVERIRAWLDFGLIVVCDRFADATRAYQGAARGLSQEVVGFLEEQATGGIKPDLTFLFDLPVEQGQKRKQRSLRRSFVQMNFLRHAHGIDWIGSQSASMSECARAILRWPRQSLSGG